MSTETKTPSSGAMRAAERLDVYGYSHHEAAHIIDRETRCAELEAALHKIGYEPIGDDMEADDKEVLRLVVEIARDALRRPK